MSAFITGQRLAAVKERWRHGHLFSARPCRLSDDLTVTLLLLPHDLRACRAPSYGSTLGSVLLLKFSGDLLLFVTAKVCATKHFIASFLITISAAKRGNNYPCLSETKTLVDAAVFPFTQRYNEFLNLVTQD